LTYRWRAAGKATRRSRPGSSLPLPIGGVSLRNAARADRARANWPCRRPH
jgi:hypothetical protein